MGRVWGRKPRSSDDVRTTRITLNVDPVEARDLLERVPRACVSFVAGGEPRVEPVGVRWSEDRYLIGLPSTIACDIVDRTEVVLLVDEGCQFFDLRAIYVRGHVLTRATVTSGESDDAVWLRVQPTRVVAWDYARIRRVDDES